MLRHHDQFLRSESEAIASLLPTRAVNPTTLTISDAHAQPSAHDCAHAVRDTDAVTYCHTDAHGHAHSISERFHYPKRHGHTSTVCNANRDDLAVSGSIAVANITTHTKPRAFSNCLTIPKSDAGIADHSSAERNNPRSRLDGHLPGHNETSRGIQRAGDVVCS